MKNTALSAENNSKRSIIFISEAHEKFSPRVKSLFPLSLY